MTELFIETYKDPKTGYCYDETSDAWKAYWGQYPSNKAVAFGGYPTYCFTDPILSKATGYSVVIQLWKGLCPKFLRLAEYPGGVGAEVGVYFRKGLDPLKSEEWWPYLTGFEFEVRFWLVDPGSNDVFFSTPTEKTWWLNRWMEEDSYAKYRQENKGAFPEDQAYRYTLEYEINGHKYPSW